MKYFTIEELARSTKAQQSGIQNQPNKEHTENLIALVDNILDPLRAAYGKPISVNSGFRSVALNTAVGGAKNSDHLKGMAADIHGKPNTKAENKKLFQLVQSLALPFKQLIDEKNYSWVHVSYDKLDVRRQVLHL